MVDERNRRRPGADALEAGLEVYEYSVAGAELTLIVHPSPGRALFDSLTSAERTVLDGLLEGLSNAELARSRGVAERTIANQLASIYRKLGVGSRSEVAALAAFSKAQPGGPSSASGGAATMKPSSASEPKGAERKARRTNGRSTEK